MCGIFGAYNRRKAAEMCYVMGHAQQHRAKEYAGIAASDGFNLHCHKGEGIVQDVFSQEQLDKLHGKCAIGQIRYSTVEDKSIDNMVDSFNPIARWLTKHSKKARKALEWCLTNKVYNAQPVLGFFDGKMGAMAHNGNIINCSELLEKLERPDLLRTSMDTEIIMRLFCESKALNIVDRVYEAVRHLRGSYSLLIMFNNTMIAIRDPWGNRPFCMGKDNGSLFFASETVAFESLGIETVRNIAPGEIFVVSDEGNSSHYFDEKGLYTKPTGHRRCHCIFEEIYYAHPASEVFGQSVIDFHLRAGAKLCQRCPADADCVIGVPDSALYHAQGYATEKGTMAIRAIARHHYIGRTFILPFQYLRDLAVRRKFTIIRKLIEGKDIVLIDDSIVRLTTMRGLIELLRWSGVGKIHVRIVAPMIISPCYYGIDTPTKEELIASSRSKDEIKELCGADSLEFLTVEDLKSLVDNPEDYCFACMTGEYPM